MLVLGDYNKDDPVAEFAVFLNKALFIGGVMLVRAVIAFCVLPGVVAFLVPFILMRFTILSLDLPLGLELIRRYIPYAVCKRFLRIRKRYTYFLIST